MLLDHHGGFMQFAIPTVKEYMTPAPICIDSQASMEDAIKLMEDQNIRHLPVLKNGLIFGLVSERDLKNVFIFSASHCKEIRIEDICEWQPYSANSDESIDVVADQMAKNKLGSVLIVDRGELMGIFTFVDACHALIDICHSISYESYIKPLEVHGLNPKPLS
jgi:acetoin utilization protein AcuB